MVGPSRKVLAVDDSTDGLFALETLLVGAGYEVFTATNGTEALAQAHAEHPDLVLLDVNMPEPDGYEVTRAIKSDPQLKFCTVVLLTAKDSLDDVVFGLDQGADDYIKKPYSKEELLARVAAALRIRSLYQQLHTLEDQNTALRRVAEQRTDYANIIGRSAAMQAVFNLIEKVKDADVPVLITGESGTGKELVAAALHYQSVRRDQVFIIQNCAALNEQLLESELFGHVKGAFTGALRDRVGLFEAANGGSLFLDEVGEMSPALQAKLLRVLQDGTFTPVGATQHRKTSVRVITATHRNLAEMVRVGTFRQDLYYRLHVVGIEIPALRDRQSDIPLLVQYFLSQRVRAGKGEKQLTEQAIAALCSYSWPGNVRELQSELERMCIMSSSSSPLGVDDLSKAVRSVENRSSPSHGSATVGALKDALADLERDFITQALKQAGGNKSEAARSLGISRSNLIAKVQEYALEDPIEQAQ